MTTTWTQRDAHGSLYVYVRGQLVMKTWPNGTERVFQKGLGGDIVFSKPVRYSYSDVVITINGVKLQEMRPVRSDGLVALSKLMGVYTVTLSSEGKM